MAGPTRLLALSLAVLGAALLPAAASAAPDEVRTDTKTVGAVTATFTHQDLGDGRWAHMRVQVVRDGELAYDAAPAAKGCRPPYCGAAAFRDLPSLNVVDVDADGEPEVIVDLFSGGAHCCYVVQVLRWDGARYVGSSHDFGDNGYQLQHPCRCGEPWTFMTADSRFAYAFSSYADSRFPVHTLTFTAGRWRDVTSKHLDLVREQAASLMAEYRKLRDTRWALGILAAWVANQWQLGRRVEAYRFLTRELHAGRLENAPPWPKRLGYIASLTRKLTIWGYAPRRP